MCPEKSILSAYFDGELDDRFASVVEAHLQECDSCTEVLADFENVRSALHEAAMPSFAASKRLTWGFLRSKFSSLYPQPVWKRRLVIPAPAVAAVLFLIVGLGAGLLLSFPNRAESNVFDMVTHSHFENPQVVSFEQIIEYLDARGNGKVLVFTLPQDTRLRLHSEPALIKTADYRRSRD